MPLETKAEAALRVCADQARQPCAIYQTSAGLSVSPEADGDAPCYVLPPVYPEFLGGGAFQQVHAVRFPYIVGEMARGIATPDMVIAASRAGFLGFFGSAGLSPDDIRAGLDKIRAGLSQPDQPFGANLIHTPQEPGYEAAVVDLFLAQGVTRVSASAYMRLSPQIVRYAAAGLSLDANGQVRRSTHVFAKVSRAEVARPFMSPAPEKMLNDLVSAGQLTAQQAELASRVPIACDITAEADSGGHTDNQPLPTVYTSVAAARAEICCKFGFSQDQIRIGLAGGIGTPHAAAAAFAMGAAYVITGSVNQACVESGLSELGKEALAKAGPADMMMAPAADMFEQGVKVQVLKRGTLFGPRGEKLYRFYRDGATFESLSDKDKAWLEDVLGERFETAWQASHAYLTKTAPQTAQRGQDDARVRFALVCRRYLFMGAQWAREGEAARRSDFQIWCGPAMGAFNEWVTGSFLEPLNNRNVAQVGWNILEGATRITRISQLRSAGLAVPNALQAFKPRELAI